MTSTRAFLETGALAVYQDPTPKSETLRLSMWRQRRQLLWGEVIALWQQDYAFRTVFVETLARVPYAAFFWETPPVSAATQNHPFEFVVVNSPSLAQVAPQPAPFADQLARTGSQTGTVRVFPNLGGDAALVVPCAQHDDDAYSHLANLVRSGPRMQLHELWQTVGRTIEAQLQTTNQPLWVSTSGLGVHWIHIRIDARPKYYTYAPYRSPTT